MFAVSLSSVSRNHRPNVLCLPCGILRQPASNSHLGVTDELHGAALVRGEAGDLTDDRLDDLGALGLGALPAGRPLGEDTALGLVAAVDTPDEAYCEGSKSSRVIRMRSCG